MIPFHIRLLATFGIIKIKEVEKEESYIPGTLPKEFVLPKKKNSKPKPKKNYYPILKYVLPAIPMIIIFGFLISFSGIHMQVDEKRSEELGAQELTRYTEDEQKKLEDMTEEQQKEFGQKKVHDEIQRLKSLSSSDLLEIVTLKANPSTDVFLCLMCPTERSKHLVDIKIQIDSSDCKQLISLFTENIYWQPRSYVASKIIEQHCL